MTESINLDTTDMVESLEFDPLDASLEEELEMLSHEEQITEIDVASGVLIKGEIGVKEEVIENMEEEEILEETIAYEDPSLDNHVIDSVMDIEDRTEYSEVEHGSLADVDNEESVIHTDNDGMFSEGVIGEEIVTDEQVIIDNESHIYENTDSEREFQDLNDVMNDNITEETVIQDSEVLDSSEMLECGKQGMEEPKLFEGNKSITSDSVFLVTPQTITSQSVLQTNSIIAPKDTKVNRFVMTGGETQTLRLVTPQGKVVSGTPKTITLAQAKQMGLLNINQIIQPSTKGGVSKLMVPKKTVTVVKSPTKILPAPPGRSQKVVIRSAGGSLKAGTLLTTTNSPVIRIPATQAAQLHLQPPNKPVQFVKLVGSNKGGTTLVPVQTISTKSIPVALSTSLLNSPQFKVVPVSSQPTVTQTVSTTQRVLIPASTPTVSSVQPQRTSIVMLQPPILSPEGQQIFEETVNTTPDESQLTQEKGAASMGRSPTNGKRASTPNLKVKEESSGKEPKSEPEAEVVEANGIRPRKPCNCTKSMCLKLYCDCFANGEFCHQCNCTTCYNNLQHEEERQRAIKSCLERNPTAFRPKIGKTYVGSEERRHNKGCNCRRSGCLKNYCECYEAKIPCSKNCKCIGCKNTDAFLKRGLEEDKLREKSDLPSYDTHYLSGHRAVLNFMSPQLMEATCQCLVAQVEEWARNGSTDLDLAQTLVIEELGRCLAQLIDCINKSISQIQHPS